MTPAPRVERLLYETPASLVDANAAPPAAMREAFAGDVERVVSHHETGTDLVAVQGPISSMKTWLLTCTAEAFLDRAHRVAILVPQKTNRRSLVDRLEQFEIPYIERPGRRDLCVWDAWQETVGRVDERICSSNGCPLYPDGRDMEQLAGEALGKYRLGAGASVQLSEETVKGLAAQLEPPVCPHYLQEALAEMLGNEGVVRVATYAKAFKSADAGEWLSADVALIDESHTVATDTSRAVLGVDLSAIVAALAAVYEYLEGSSTKLSYEVVHDIEPLVSALRDWRTASWERPVSPDELFDEAAISLSDAFGDLGRARSEVMAELRRAVSSGRSERANRLGAIDGQLQEVVGFLSRIQSYRDGDLDFVHTRYEARGEAINDVEFRRVADRDAASTPREVYEAWCEEGTAPAIEARWGNLLDPYIEAIWLGRTVSPGGDRSVPGAPLPALAELRSITGAETMIGYSATHNDVSDPARPAGDLRRTAHRVVTAPLQLRSDGDERSDYNGRTSVDAATPWFRSLVRRAKNETDTRLAAVPINSKNEAKWEAMPVERLELPDGRGGTGRQTGLVPHSRGAIGDKGLEQLSIDAVLCGVQVQSPAETARRVVAFWELLAPEHDDPAEALERGWRLLAQHAVSGTIQAAGRFRTGATNIVFERPGLVELAGFECERLSPSMDGFAGAFARAFAEARERFERRRRPVRAAKVVRYLERTPSKSPTRAQYLSKFSEVHGATEREATRAFEAAVEAGMVEYVAGVLRTTPGHASGRGPGG